MKRYDVAIIGAGTSGLTARKEIAKMTDNYIVIDDGPLGTTCARVGCMPSKVLIQVANDFHRRFKFEQLGINGANNLAIDRKKAMAHVRSLRDRFVRGVKSSMPDWENKLIREKATFLDKNTLLVGDEKVQADKIIIATGSRPIIPKAWENYKSHLITTDQFFELEQLPQKVAVIGLGVIGLELGQALNRMGVEVIAAGLGKEVGALSDPELQDYTISKLKEEMNISINGANLLGINEEGKLQVEVDGKIELVEKAIIAVGRRPNIDKLNIQNLDLSTKDNIPSFSRSTFQLEEAQNIFIAGDILGERPLLHEAADEGFIAGFVAANNEGCFQRRTPIAITFSDPNIAVIGKRYKELEDEKIDFVTGKVSFEGQGRSIVKLKEIGQLHIYADKKSGSILGAELFAPDGEHLAHLIAWGISLNLRVQDMLKMPFYHPVIEEGLRTALRDARSKLDKVDTTELLRCQDTLIR